MEAEDQRVHTEVYSTGGFGGGYRPRLKAVHRAHSARLREMIATHGMARPLPGRLGRR
jgi:hypothetical protein